MELEAQKNEAGIEELQGSCYPSKWEILELHGVMCGISIRGEYLDTVGLNQ